VNTTDGAVTAPLAPYVAANAAAPLLELEGARIDCGGFTTAPLDATGGVRLVALVGYASPIFRLLRGDARLAGGSVRLAGLDVREAVTSGAVALASRTAPPVDWTVRRFLVASARLVPLAKHDIERRVQDALERFRLGAVAAHALRDLPDSTRCLVALARAGLGDAAVVFVEAPFSDLDSSMYTNISAALENLAERRLLVSFPAEPEADRGRSWLDRADFSVRLAPGDARVVSH
jgi:hypothetical protein